MIEAKSSRGPMLCIRGLESAGRRAVWPPSSSPGLSCSCLHHSRRLICAAEDLLSVFRRRDLSPGSSLAPSVSAAPEKPSFNLAANRCSGTRSPAIASMSSNSQSPSWLSPPSIPEISSILGDADQFSLAPSNPTKTGHHQDAVTAGNNAASTSNRQWRPSPLPDPTSALQHKSRNAGLGLGLPPPQASLKRRPSRQTYFNDTKALASAALVYQDSPFSVGSPGPLQDSTEDLANLLSFQYDSEEPGDAPLDIPQSKRTKWEGDDRESEVVVKPEVIEIIDLTDGPIDTKLEADMIFEDFEGEYVISNHKSPDPCEIPPAPSDPASHTTVQPQPIAHESQEGASTRPGQKHSHLEYNLHSTIQFRCFDSGEHGWKLSFNPFDQEQSIFAMAGDGLLSVWSCKAAHRTQNLLSRRILDDKRAKAALYAVEWLYDAELREVYVAVGGNSSAISVFGLSSNSHRLLQSHGADINDLKRHPRDDVILASASRDRSIRIWNAKRGMLLAILGGCGHKDTIYSINFNDDGTRLISSSHDHQVLVWDSYTPELAELMERSHSLDRQPSSYIGLRYRTDGPTQIKDHVLRVYFPLEQRSDIFRSIIDWSSWFGSAAVFTKGISGRIRLWKYEESPQAQESRHIKLTGSEYGFPLLRKVTPIIYEFTYPEEIPVYFIFPHISPSGRYLAVGNSHGDVFIWDILDELNRGLNQLESKCRINGTRRKMPRWHKCLVRSVCFSNDDRFLVSISDDGALCVWEKRIIKTEEP
ncbi:WD40-repeat-containing domain protein [Polychytrium aggregatum]|uniref:WD40-repeat-containing domain protein n=1 Tax=Polychytrium aggregatum TaxID=110093 RepID=UPI0022FE4100|nr:WD40-repeat-containing domain protein [Polychytrium aggregatum]KAI9207316.1 WD40-repeat-containing domain protein [Polychytrium aggregatum]